MHPWNRHAADVPHQIWENSLPCACPNKDVNHADLALFWCCVAVKLHSRLSDQSGRQKALWDYKPASEHRRIIAGNIQIATTIGKPPVSEEVHRVCCAANTSRERAASHPRGKILSKYLSQFSISFRQTNS